jgi:cytochrome P450
MGIVLTLFSAAGDLTASLLGSAAWILAERPEIQKQVREERELLNAFIEEALRYEPPFRGHYRDRHRRVVTQRPGPPAEPFAVGGQVSRFSGDRVAVI